MSKSKRDNIQNYFSSLSNWGRWGTDDEAGTLNLVTPDSVTYAASLVRSGIRISCSRTLGMRSARRVGTQQFIKLMVASGETASAKGETAAADWFAMGCHGFDFTHLDCHSHFIWDGSMYNGRSASLVTTERGALAGGLEPAFDGILGRGILIDGPRLKGKEWLEPGEGLSPEDLANCYETNGLEVREGDFLFVRTGRDAWESNGQELNLGEASPGLDGACLPWLHDNGIAVLVSDVANDVRPSGYAIEHPIHAVGIVAMGMWLVDNADLGTLPALAESQRTIQFCAIMAPLAIRRATGSPINPIAVF